MSETGDYPVVETLTEKVRGRASARAKVASAKQSYRFAGIPFAQPPVGALRFEPPQKAKPWLGVRDGLRCGPMPHMPRNWLDDLEGWQAIVDEFGEDWTGMDEDCLHLNVYTSRPGDQQAKLPVLFWIYGGGFQIGSHKFYDGSVLTSMHDVVVVVPNYRLSSFGFLSLKDASPSGNMGLLDQVMALQWVRDNIKFFGGDDENVTIFGESAGAVSVSLHLHSPLSRNLFHKAISHSGVCEFPTLVNENNDLSVKLLLEELHIEENDDKTRLEKLKQVPASKIAAANNKLVKDFHYFCPIFEDGVFFPRNLNRLVKEGIFKRVPYMLGVNNSEGFGIIAPGKNLGFDQGLSEESARAILGAVLSQLAPEEKKEKIMSAVIDEYGAGLEGDVMRWSRIAGSLFADLSFVLPSIKMAGLHADSSSPTYFYCMTQALRFSHDPDYNLSAEPKMKSAICECDHTDDVVFTFGIPFSAADCVVPVRFTEAETRFSEAWMNYIVNFAYTGDPNRGPNKVELKWLRYNSENKNYLKANANPSIQSDLSPDKLSFWTQTLPKLLYE